jgi:hypothetical protein
VCARLRASASREPNPVSAVRVYRRGSSAGAEGGEVVSAGGVDMAARVGVDMM